MLVASFATPALASAATTYYYFPGTTGSYQYQYPVATANTYYGYGNLGGSQMTQSQLIAYLQQLIIQLQAQLSARGGNTGYSYGYGYTVGEPRSHSSSRNNDDEPDLTTDSATNINRNDARLRGSVEMNDFEDGEVFFVYGTDEDQVEDIEDDYDSYRDIDKDGDRLQKVLVDSSLDGDEDYSYKVTGLKRDTEYFFQICVGFEDEDGDDVILCGGVEEFETDN